MNRWTSTLFIFLASLLVSTASAQTEEFKPNIRPFPKEAKRGELVVLSAPDIAIDGKADRLSPGVRIRDAKNNLILSGTLANQPLIVNYVRDNIGLVHNVWVLSSDEIKQKMPGQPEGLISNIRSMFDTPVVKDDGKTPFNQLPKYKQ
jgi:hypothetical protein